MKYAELVDKTYNYNRDHLSISRGRLSIIVLPIECYDIDTFVSIIKYALDKIPNKSVIHVSKDTIYAATKYFELLDLTEIFKPAFTIFGIPMKYDNQVEFGKMEIY